MLPEPLLKAAEQTLSLCRERGFKLSLAESCTGGLIAAAITSIPGSSDVFERGYVSYANESKVDMLDVPASKIEKYGAVSEQVAREMVSGALAHSSADVAISVTGIAGPGGGSEEKPVGTVFIAIAKSESKTECYREHFAGDRNQVRLQASLRALERLEMILRK